MMHMLKTYLYTGRIYADFLWIIHFDNFNIDDVYIQNSNNCFWFYINYLNTQNIQIFRR